MVPFFVSNGLTADNSLDNCDNCDNVLLLHFQGRAALTLSATKVAHTRSLCPCELCLDDRHLWPLLIVVPRGAIHNISAQPTISHQRYHRPRKTSSSGANTWHMPCQYLRQKSSNLEIDLFRYYGRLLMEAT